MSVWDIAILKILPGMFSVAQFCPTLCNPMDCSPPDSSDHGIFWARILKCFLKNIEAASSSRGSSQPRDGTRVSWVSWPGRQILHHCTTWKALPRDKKAWLRSPRKTWLQPQSHALAAGLWSHHLSICFLYPLNGEEGGNGDGGLWWVNEVTHRHLINYKELYSCKSLL